MEAIAVTGALYLARAARDSLGPRVKAAAERYFRQKEKEEEESQTKAFLSRGFEWVEDVFPAVALGCAGLAANNQVPITILSLAFAWILGCRAHRWWLHQADEQDDAALTDVPEKLSRITRLWESLFPSKQSSVIYAHSTYKQDKVLGITGNLNRRADYLSVEEELVGQRLHEEVRQRLDMSGEELGAYIAAWLTTRVGEVAGGTVLRSTSFANQRNPVIDSDAMTGLDKTAKKTVANIQNEMWDGPALTVEEKKNGFNYAAWVIVQLKDRNEGRLLLFWHRVEEKTRHSGVVALRLTAPFMARFVEPSKWRPYTPWHWFLLVAAAGPLVGALAHHHTGPPVTPKPTSEGIEALWMAAAELLGAMPKGKNSWIPW